MEIALYCPKIGYYERPGALGAPEGDFYTSVTANPLFAEMLAFQFAEWLQELGNKSFALVETGTHDGSLARGILSWLQAHQPNLLERVTYYIVEPSEERKGWQTRQLDIFARQIRWVESLDVLPALHGIIFSNELLDAMPLHRFTWRAAQQVWVELGVGLEGERFVWAELSSPSLDLAPELTAAGFEIPEELQAVLPEGFCIELSPAARQWWHSAANLLERGKLLTIDYGLEAQEFLAPQRKAGTLRSYWQHQLVEDVLLVPGGQDITAHVNFTQLLLAGEGAGLQTSAFISQERFLGEIVRKIANAPGIFDEWTPPRTRQLQTLIHPEHLGRPFRVLVQSRLA
jgi:SAM-dependent MidA family methyltransferase